MPKGMASWRIRIPVSYARKLFIKRHFTFGIVLASISFLGYLLLFAPSQNGRSLCECPCATRPQTENNNVKPQTEAAITSTGRVFTQEVKVEHDSSSGSLKSLNVHTWSEICGMSVDILRNWPHFPFFPEKRSFIELNQ